MEKIEQPTADELLTHGQLIYSPKEVAAAMNKAGISCDKSTVTRWCESGKMEAIKPRGRWIISRQGLVNLLVSFGIAISASTTGSAAIASHMKQLVSNNTSHASTMLVRERKRPER